MANICQCGCGELLPEGSTRQFKRGHKDRISNPEADAGVFTETPLGEDGELPQPLFPSLEDLAGQVPDDPEPRDQPEFRVKAPAIKITAGVRRDVEGKLAFAFALSGQLWVMADPTCGAVFLNQTPDIAKKLTPIVCQSPDVVKWLTKSSNFVLYIDLFMACWPVIQIMVAHHITKSLAEQVSNANGQRVAPNEYVVS